MGKIIVNIFHNGKDIRETPIEGKPGMYGVLSQKYNIPKIQSLEFEGNDVNAYFEIDSEGGGIDWNAVSYPNTGIGEQVNQIIYFQSIYDELAVLSYQINRCSFEDRYDIERFGQRALEVIRDMRRVDNADTEHRKDSAIQRINQTLRDDVRTLKAVKANASGRDKEQTLASTKRQLINDITNFTNLLK